jgi:adenylate kinase family enzyme
MPTAWQGQRVDALDYPRIAIFGNSGSGKSTRARELSRGGSIPVLELDSIVWEPGKVAVARPVEAARADLARFCGARAQWIVEGCYGDLIEATLEWDPLLLFMDPGEEVCLRHNRARPWEPHKYASKQEQDSKLEYLLAWVSAYYQRDDDCSLARHRALFDRYRGPKERLVHHSPA